MEAIGWLGSIMLAVCGLPQLITCIRTKSALGVDLGFLLLWLGGEILTFAYALTLSDVTPLLFNYSCNILCISGILYYKWRGV